MGTVWWFDDLFTLEAGRQGFTADGARGTSKIGVSAGGRLAHVDHVVVAAVVGGR